MLGQSLTEATDYVKALYYGDPGSGKTTAMASLAKLGPIAAIDFEGSGWLASSLRKRGIPVENIKLFRPSSYDELEEVYWDIMGMINEDFPLMGVCLDHMTELEAILVRDAAYERIERSERKIGDPSIGTAKEQDAKSKAIANLDPFLTDIADYGKWTHQARKLVRMYRDLPCHVAFGAHVRTDMGKLVPSLTEKARNDLAGSMNMVIATVQEDIGDNVAYIGYLRSIKRYVGKDRFDVTRPIMAEPTMDRLVKLTTGELDAATDPVQAAFKQLKIGG